MTVLVERSLFPAVVTSAAIAAWLVCLPSCGGQELPVRAGASDAPAAGSSAPEPEAAKPTRWERFAELSSMVQLAGPLPSRGHGTGEWTVQLRANAAGAASIDSVRRGSSMPRGAVLVALHADRRNGAAAEGLFMEKREAGWFPEGGDWEYGVIAPDGLVQSRGKLGFCARCHAEAPADYVFPRPASAP